MTNKMSNTFSKTSFRGRNLFLIAIIIIMTQGLVRAQDNVLCELGDLNTGGNGQDYYAAAFHKGDLYAGTLSIRKHLGNNNWQSLFDFGSAINAITSYSRNLYVANRFGVFFIDEANNEIVPLSDQLEWVTGMYANDDKLYMGGGFSSSELKGIAVYDGENLSQLGAGFNTVPPGFSLDVNGISEYNGDLVATGRFKNAGTTEVNSLALWNGEAWQPFGSGLYWADHPEGYGYGNAVVQWNDQLVVGGFFDSVDGNAIPNLAQWDGTSWSSIGNETIGSIQDLIVAEGVLYITGSYVITLDGVSYDVAAWDGVAWYGLLRANGIVFGFTVDATEDNLVVFGGFSQMNDGDPDEFVVTGGICDMINCTTVDIEEPAESSLKVYPNPVVNNLFISNLNDGMVEGGLLEIYNMHHQNIQQLQLSASGNQEAVVDFSAFPAGVYFIKLSTTSKTSWHKVIKAAN